jgi:penicillin amidase
MSMPAAWTLNEINWGDNYMVGGTIPGIPLVHVGRTRHIAWAITATLIDNTDLWEEQLNDERTRYLVDGEWRDLEKRHERILVKGRDPVEFAVDITHRGPVMDYDVLSAATVLLFAGTTPKIDRKLSYSFGWAQSAKIRDSTWDLVAAFCESTTVSKIFETADKMSVDGYNGLAANWVFADLVKGDIGYMATAAVPVRKD